MRNGTDEVLFVKVQNDGFDLGAQRRPIEKNDLPEAFKVLKDWKDETAMLAVPKETNAAETGLFLSVARKRLLESPDINVG